jgi:hypothetical protein
MRRLYPQESTYQLYFSTCLIFSFLGYRSIYRYGAYPTPSKDHIGLLPTGVSTLEWVNKYEENIAYHAKWRVYLYFLLLIAYHNQKRVIQIDSTELQHGVGIAPHLQACHTSLFPNLIDGIVDKPGGRHETSIIDQSFMNHWNNMTVVCPVISNRFDTFLEGRGSGSRLRKELLFVLNSCSFGCYTPLDALRLFYIHIEDALSHQKNFFDKFETEDEKRAAQRVVFFQKNSMFSLASPIRHYPNIGIFGKILELTNLKATQELLLTGGKKEAKEFLKRFG